MIESHTRQKCISLLVFLFTCFYSFGFSNPFSDQIAESSFTCQAQIKADTTEACVNSPFIIIETSTPALGGFEITEWAYTFDDFVVIKFKGNTDTITNGSFITQEDHTVIQVTYLSPGPKKIGLQITSTDSPGNGGTCIDETSILVTAVALPFAEMTFDDEKICQGDSTNITFTFPNALSDEHYLRYKIDSLLSLDSILMISGHIETVQITSDSAKVSIVEIESLVSGCSVEFENPLEQTIYAIPLPDLVLDKEISPCLGESDTLSVSGANVYQWMPIEGLSNPSISNPVFTAINPGINSYEVIGLDTNGCKSILLIDINVLPPPPMAQIDRLDATCSTVCNIVLELKNGSGMEVIWDVMGNNFDGDTYGEDDQTYVIDLSNVGSLPDELNMTVTLINEQGCKTESIGQIDLSETTIDCPEIVQRSCDKRLVLLDEITCYSWGYIDETTGDIVHNISSTIFLYDADFGNNNRLYFVESFDCNDPNCRNVVIFRSSESNIIDCQIQDHIAVFPNPTTGDFEINVENEITGQHSFYMFDNLGRLRHETTFEKFGPKAIFEMKITNIPPGVYHCKLVAENGVYNDFNVFIVD